MRPIREAGGIQKDDAVDPKHSWCGATPLQTGGLSDHPRRTASQFWEGSYLRDLGTRPAHDGLGAAGFAVTASSNAALQIPTQKSLTQQVLIAISAAG